jgi:signal transduction histidine kinase
MPMRSWPEFLARWMLRPGLGFAAALVLLALGLLVGTYEERLYRLQKIQETDVQARILADSVAAALVFEDPTAAQTYVVALSENPEVDAVGVYDQNGSKFAAFEREGSTPLPLQMTIVPTYYEDGRVHATIPVIQNGMRVGIVYVRETTESLQRSIIRYGGIILLVTMGVLILIVVGLAQTTLSRANAELAEKAKALTDTNRKLHAEMEERAKAEDALRQSQKMEAIGQLSGGIAHDFNNLLTIVKGNLQLMQRRIAHGTSDVQRYVDAATEAISRATGLTQRILAFSRRQPLSPKPVDLSRLIAGMDDLLRHSVGHEVEIETRLDADWWTLCDTNQMENVILNLANNARDAMPGGGKLVIETRNFPVPPGSGDILPGDYVLVRVQDTGVGMSDEIRQKAIDPFFTTKPVGQGTGLGLSMTFGYVRQSNGYLLIESAPGAGTTIRIFMPRYHIESLAATA